MEPEVQSHGPKLSTLGAEAYLESLGTHELVLRELYPALVPLT